MAPTPWHHDQPYWTVDGNQVCSIWLSLDPVPREAAVRFVARIASLGTLVSGLAEVRGLKRICGSRV